MEDIPVLRGSGYGKETRGSQGSCQEKGVRPRGSILGDSLAARPALYSPQTAIHGCGSPGDDLGDEDTRVIRNMGVVDASRYAEAQPGVTLWEIKRPRLSPRGNCLLPAFLKCLNPSPAAGLPGAQEPLGHLSHPAVPGSGGRGMLAGGEAAVPQLSAQSTEQMEWESGSRRGPPSAPRLHGEAQAGGEPGEEEVVLGGESLPWAGCSPGGDAAARTGQRGLCQSAASHSCPPAPRGVALAQRQAGDQQY